MKTLLIAIGFFSIVMQPLMVGAVTFKSTSKQVGLLELYTSEGCSSCPAADRWLTSLRNNEELWVEIIPIAFHVDYWDYIGWKDRFAKAEYSNRQRQYEQEQSVNTVYTPGFVYNGKEWRNWFFRRFLSFPDGGMPGELTLEIDGQIANIDFNTNGMNFGKLHISLALLGFGLQTEVEAGENQGRILSHDFVVLDINKAKLTQEDMHYRGKLTLPVSKTTVPQYGIVAWVSKIRKQAPLQSVGGWLP